MTPSEKLKEIADQLRHPHGSKGMEMATMMQETNANMTRQSVEALAINSNDKILEIGHGNATHVLELYQQYPNLHYQGLEVSTLMHELAKENNQKLINQGLANFKLYKADSPLPYAKDTFDKVFTVNTHYFWEEPQLMFEEIHRVLQVGGSFGLTFGLKQFMKKLPFTAYHFKLYEMDELQAMAVASGFTNQALRQDTESIPSKTGEWVERQFATLVFRK